MSKADTYRWHGEAMQVAAEAMKGGGIDYAAIARARADAQNERDRRKALRDVNYGHVFDDCNWTCVCGLTKREYMATSNDDRRVCLGKPYELLPE